MTDLEKAIELARKHEGLYGIRNHEECCVAACQEMAEWKEKQIIEKACEWLHEHVRGYKYYDTDYQDVNIDIDDLIYTFKKAMDEQL